jgi:galactose-1-phosphate uridylyltransferase
MTRRIPPLVHLPDGTIKQVSPLTGTVVWTVPGRAHRPITVPVREPHLIDPADADAYCAFCPQRYLETPPEKSRVVLDAGGSPVVLDDLPAEHLFDTIAELRRVPNLFEILSVDYWRANHGYQVPREVRARAARYIETPLGREHVLTILHRRLASQGLTDSEWASVPETAWLTHAVDLFSGTHDVIAARRHYVDGATHDDELAGSGSLTPGEHGLYVAFTVESMRRLYEMQPSAEYVAVFQNWLRPAGASFDHLHKQLVAIDEPGPQSDRVLVRLREDPQLFGGVIDHAAANRLIIAENDVGVAVAGVGHRYPSVEVYSASDNQLPWEHTEDEVRGFSDLLHAVHAATGAAVPTNEEWHHRPPGIPEAMPWHVTLKWRVSTLAGFEGGTKINVNTLDPASVRSRVVSELRRLREAGSIAELRIGEECSHAAGLLRYAG